MTLMTLILMFLIKLVVVAVVVADVDACDVDEDDMDDAEDACDTNMVYIYMICIIIYTYIYIYIDDVKGIDEMYEMQRFMQSRWSWCRSSWLVGSSPRSNCHGFLRRIQGKTWKRKKGVSRNGDTSKSPICSGNFPSCKPLFFLGSPIYGKPQQTFRHQISRPGSNQHASVGHVDHLGSPQAPQNMSLGWLPFPAMGLLWHLKVYPHYLILFVFQFQLLFF